MVENFDIDLVIYKKYSNEILENFENFSKNLNDFL